MARLTAAARRKIPKSKFAYTTTVVNKRTGKKEKKGHYPIEDKAHARIALALIRFAKKPKAVKKLATKELYGTSNPAKIEKIKKERAKKSSRKKT